ncbi:endoplasmin homolog [Papaver somniferum]|uniref:endoplasmin homolog n=1 Tax=Papaver somniferum TaxID=3469 RepID=UPI000E6F4C3B|nr:endoplasmin homolog [Papaver somniferum]XP_026435881.1 endoplasmin homolog [Papaver somniferum]
MNQRFLVFGLIGTSQVSDEGDVEFKAVLFVPPKAPHDLYGSYYNANKSNLKLYVRRVFISDGFDDLLPKYLNFLMGNTLGSWLKMDSSAANQTTFTLHIMHGE